LAYGAYSHMGRYKPKVQVENSAQCKLIRLGVYGNTQILFNTVVIRKPVRRL